MFNFFLKSKLIKYLLVFSFFIILFIFVVNFWVIKAVQSKLYHSTDNIPKNKVGLLLGTRKYLGENWINRYYKFRIEAAVKLYNADKVEFILVSGDNSQKEYDEPTTMKNDLIAKGIPESKIYLDYAGFRTYDSVVRCNKIFGQKNITIISQKFHNERAIFIALQKNINAIGYNAKDVNIRAGFKVMIREWLARIKMVWDLATNKQPKFFGEKIEIK